MRPKKVILCVDSNEQRLSILKFTLATNGYRALTAVTDEEAAGLFTSTHVDLVLAELGVSPVNKEILTGVQLVARLKHLAPHVPMILLGDPKALGDQVHIADALLVRTFSTGELLERIKVMAARKRGPRKGCHPAQSNLRQEAVAS